jgi:hypothetical protein
LLIAAAWIGAALIVTTLPATKTHAQQPSRVTAALEQHLYAGKLADGEQALRRILAEQPGDAEAQFALGGVMLARAVERFGQGLYRHGLQAPRTMLLPLFDLPVPVNPRPQPLSYEQLRELFAQLVLDLDAAEAELARVTQDDVKLKVDLARIRLDLDGNGIGEDREKLSAIISTLAEGARRRGMRAPSGDDSFPVAFDVADAYWMRGYANLIGFAAEFFLAHDFRATFDATFHLFFPHAGLPFGRMVGEPAGPNTGIDMGPIFDAIAFIHLVRWDVTEPQRMANMHARLKRTVELSRKTWAAVLAESDDDDEWLPGPKQKGVLDMPVTIEMVGSWLAMLDEVDAVLDGRKLVPHPRFQRGINLRKVFLEPKQFDLVLWVTGQGVLPFLADGPVLDTRTWNQASQVFRGNFLSYAMWFN